MELFNESQASCEAEFDQPLIAYLRAKKEGRTVAPFVPEWDLSQISKLCRKALAWSVCGFKKEAGELAHFILQYEKFLPLWSSQQDFNEEETRRLLTLVKSIEPVETEAPDFGASFFHSMTMDAAFTLSGNGTSLGMIRAGDVEIRAIGPQALPLTDNNRFGIKGKGINGWTSCFARPEVWVEVKYGLIEEECKISLNFVGLVPEAPTAFAFYVKAPSCKVGNDLLKPKTLTRFNGEGRKIQFNHLTIESSRSHKIQIIPLAGFGGFWNCEFLAAFEIHHLESQVSFSIKS